MIPMKMDWKSGQHVKQTEKAHKIFERKQIMWKWKTLSRRKKPHFVSLRILCIKKKQYFLRNFSLHKKKQTSKPRYMRFRHRCIRHSCCTNSQRISRFSRSRRRIMIKVTAVVLYLWYLIATDAVILTVFVFPPQKLVPTCTVYKPSVSSVFKIIFLERKVHLHRLWCK